MTSRKASLSLGAKLRISASKYGWYQLLCLKKAKTNILSSFLLSFFDFYKGNNKKRNINNIFLNILFNIVWVFIIFMIL